MPYVPYAEMIGKLPIYKGDILYIASNVLAIAKICRDYGENFDGEIFIKSIQDAVGENGTIMFPTFNWDFCGGIAFDYCKTKGKAGVLGNIAMKIKGFKRTMHPIYSFAVWGKDQSYLVGLTNKESFGEDSPFAYLHRHNAKALLIGLEIPYNSFTLYIEQKVGVEYRYHKDFYASYIDADGRSEKKTYSMYVRDLELNPTRVWPAAFHNALITLGIRKDFDINGIPFNVVNLPGFFEVTSLDIRYNDAKNIYKYSK